MPDEENKEEKKSGTKIKQKNLEGKDLPEVEKETENREIVTYSTTNFQIRTTPESVEKYQELDVDKQEAWIKRKMRCIGAKASGKDFEAEYKALFASIIG